MAEPQSKRTSFDKDGETTSTANTSLHGVAGKDDAQAPGSSMDLAREEKGEKASPSENQENVNTSNFPGSADFRRPFGNFRWALITLGFCLGAFLYGTYSTDQ
jgi:hypothetical protein